MDSILRALARRRPIAAVLLALGIAMVPIALLAQASPPAPLTVDAAVRIALDRNPRLRAAAEGVRVADEAVGEARAPYYPTLDASAGYTRWETHAYLPGGLAPDLPSTIGPTNDWTAGFTGRYTLYDSGRRAADLRAALA